MILTDEERRVARAFGLTDEEYAVGLELADATELPESVELAEDRRFARLNGLTAEQFAAWKRAGLSRRML